MRDLIKKYQRHIIIACSALLVFGIYFYWKSGDTPMEDAATLDFTQGPAPEDAVFGAEILSALNDLLRLKLDARVFSDPVFRSLVDYSVSTTSEPLGRPDPFAPLSTTSKKNN